MGYLEEYRDWRIRIDQGFDSTEEFKKWLKANPEPVLSEAEHRRMLNKCLVEANKKNDQRKNIFCPVVKGNCVTTCECYEKATVNNTTIEKCDDNYGYYLPNITGGYCKAYILKGGH